MEAVFKQSYFSAYHKNRHRGSQENKHPIETFNIMKFNEVNKVLVEGNMTSCLQ